MIIVSWLGFDWTKKWHTDENFFKVSMKKEKMGYMIITGG